MLKFVIIQRGLQIDSRHFCIRFKLDNYFLELKYYTQFSLIKNYGTLEIQS